METILQSDEFAEDKENVPVTKCGICGALHYYRECGYVVINNKILDTPTIPKAIQSLPNILKLTKLGDESTSVFAKSLIEVGTEFGPLVAKKSLTLNPETLFSIKVFSEQEADLTEYYLDCTDEHACCWMMFVKPAEHVGEQNLLCYQEQNDIYFGAIKDIEPGEELKVWYSPYYASKMGKHLLSFDVTILQDIEPVIESDPKDLNVLVNEQQKIVPRAVWNCKFCYKLEKNVTDFAKHLIGHYCMRQKRTCEFCSVSFSYKADYDKHLKLHKQSSLENSNPEPKKNPSILQCPDSFDNSNFLLPQMELNIVNLENLENNLLLDDNLRLNLDMDVTGEEYDNNRVEDLVCDICLKKFKSKPLLVAHLRMHLGAFYCASCNRVFGRKETLKHHKCTTSFFHKCPKCSKTFSQKKRLNFHIKAFHDLKYSCPHCHRKCFGQTELKNHVCAEDPNRILKCPTCSRNFSNERSFRFHMKMHETTYGPVRYVCSECSQLYSSKVIYERHLKTVHSQNKQFTCQICDKKFARRDILNTHLLEIHLQATFACKFCEKPFTSKRNRDCHIRNIHTNQKTTKYSCKECPVQFTYMRNLQRHMKLNHTYSKDVKTGEKIKCSLCPREYNYFRSLQAHTKAKHSQQYFNEKLRSNKDDGSIHCPECWQKFPKRKMTSLKRHVWNQHRQRFDSFCQEFNLENESMFRCPLCPKEFIVKDSLQRHLKTHNNSELNAIIPKEAPITVQKASKPNTNNETHKETCLICGHKFKLNSSLLRHMKQKHPSKENPNSTLSKKAEEKETNLLGEEEFDNYMDLQKTIENMDFNVDMVNDNQLSCNEFIDKFLKESSDQISLFLTDSPKLPTPTVNVDDQNQKKDIIGLSMLDFPDLDFSEIELEPLGPSGGRTPMPSIDSLIPDVVLYLRNDK
ncbi:unnamed protein product [Ceutorhynchus assimilis]|uniref:Uncharacterized protein n=1 Tax=Ceutorhynchus assimilis TaxID=467358 RepID=A0A9N9QR41_9CUCU|nr:unnamed protein product [Ceutorhynchus assimilis]